MRIYYFLIDNWKEGKAKVYCKKNKKTFHYRKNFDWKNYEISEKRNIEDKIKASWIIDKILWISNESIVTIKKNLELYTKKSSSNKIKTLKAQKNLYKSFLERSKFLLDEENKKEEIIFHSKQVNIYNKKLDALENEIRYIQKWDNILVEDFLNLFTIKNFFSEDVYTKRDFYLIMFEKITYNKEKQLQIILYDYLYDVWLPKTINI